MAIEARIKEIREIDLDDLEIGLAQVRVRGVAKDIEELAESIRAVGLLEPIVVAESESDSGRYEIVTGQRRYLAHRYLKEKTIPAAILDRPVSEMDAKVLSVTENLVRRDLETKDLIDVCTYLYKHYGSVTAVADETGLSPNKIRRYIKYEQLVDPLRQLVDNGQVKLATALRAQQAASVSGETKDDEAVEFALNMESMSGAMQSKIVKDRESDPTADADEVLESAKAGGKITQIVVTLTSTSHTALGNYAKDLGTNQDDAARVLIEQGLEQTGFLGED